MPRPTGRTGLPVPASKFGLNEMTESQNNSRATALPQPSTYLKHKASDRKPAKRPMMPPSTDSSEVVEPPSKQRKVANHYSESTRPASALGTTRTMASSTNMPRPQSRMLPPASQSVSANRPQSGIGGRSLVRPNTSASIRQPTKGHVRAKSQNTGLMRSAAALRAQEEEEKSQANGMNSISIRKTSRRHNVMRAVRSTSAPLKPVKSSPSTSRHVSAPEPEAAVSLRPVPLRLRRFKSGKDDDVAVDLSKLKINDPCPRSSASFQRPKQGQRDGLVRQQSATPTRQGSKIPQITPKLAAKATD